MSGIFNPKTILSAILHENINDYLQAKISSSQIRSPVTVQTTALTIATVTTPARRTRATRRKTKTTAVTTTTPPANPLLLTNTSPSNDLAALAQLDTGCQVGDVVNRRVLRGLQGEPHLRTTDTPLWMCSGLNSQCIESTHVLDIVVSFKKDFLQYTLALPVRIAEDSKVDLILGLKTIKDLNLVNILPEFFQNLDQIKQDVLPQPMSKQLKKIENGRSRNYYRTAATCRSGTCRHLH